MKNQLFTLLVCVFFFISCKKNKTDPPVAQTDVYVAGIQPTGGNDKGVVWKNGNVTINSLSGNTNHYAHAIALSGSDVFTTGYENSVTGLKCHVWKNGLLQYSLGDAASYGNGIALSGNDIYIAGAVNEGPGLNRSVLWKNTDVSGFTILASGAGIQATGVAVSGTDVYVCGQDITVAGNIARIWKNGVPMSLNNAASCYINALVIDGTDVYAVADVSGAGIRYWKNGVSNDITTANAANAHAIAVSNNDVYIAGRENIGGKAVAKYWKNGVAVSLGDGIRSSFATGIAVKGSDVYVCGTEQGANNTTDYATVWRNGQRQTIGLQNSRATAIVLK